MHDCFAIELTGGCLKCFIRLTRDVPAVVVQSEALWARIPEIQVRIPSRAMGTFFPHTVSSIFRLSLTHTHTHTHTYKNLRSDISDSLTVNWGGEKASPNFHFRLPPNQNLKNAEKPKERQVCPCNAYTTRAPSACASKLLWTPFKYGRSPWQHIQSQLLVGIGGQ